MNFHPDKQFFQVASTGDQTTDPWITRPVLYPYTTGTQSYFIFQHQENSGHCATKYYKCIAVQMTVAYIASSINLYRHPMTAQYMQQLLTF